MTYISYEKAVVKPSAVLVTVMLSSFASYKLIFLVLEHSHGQCLLVIKSQDS